MPTPHRRMRREAKTVRAMVRIYCHGKHQTRDALCPDCAGIQEYALKRLEHCPYQEKKTTCASCPTHCYAPDMKDRLLGVKEIF